MTDQRNVTVEAEEGNVLLSSLRHVLMAGIGAVVLAQDEIEDFVTKLVDRGEIAEVDARRLLSEVAESRQSLLQNGSSETVELEVDSRRGNVLAWINIPSKTEIDQLNDRIAELTEKVDELVALESE